MEQLDVRAMGKINLGLDVLRRREDGYHEVRMIMQTVNIFDRLRITRLGGPGIQMKTNLPYLPTDESNLAVKAARLLTDEFKIDQGVRLDLQKNIPVAAGMAGGSSDAAAVLYGMNRMFGLGLSLEQLMERGVRLGADVPYCLMRGTALAEGIGEKLTRLPSAPQGHLVIARPGISVSTKFVYTNLRLDSLREHPDIDGQIEAIRRGDLARMAALMGNVLETVTIRKYPEIEKIKLFLKDQGALNAMMSGSGPTVFGLFDCRETAQRACEQMKKSGLAKVVYLTSFFQVPN